MAWWDPVSWGQWVRGNAARVSDDVVTFVTNAVSNAINLVEKDLDVGVDFVSNIIEDVKNDLTAGVDFVADAAKDLFNDAERDIANGIHAAESLASRLYNDVEHDLSVGLKYVESAASTLYDEAKRDLETGLDVVKNEAESLVDSAISLVERYADDVYNTFVRDIFDPLKHDAEQALSWAEQMWRWFDTGVVDAWKVIVEAWDWIEWFAKWSFDEIENFGQELENDGSDIVSSFITNLAGSDWMGNLESTLSAIGW